MLARRRLFGMRTPHTLGQLAFGQSFMFGRGVFMVPQTALSQLSSKTRLTWIRRTLLGRG